MRPWSGALLALLLVLWSAAGAGAAAEPAHLFSGRTVLALASYEDATYAGTDGGLLVSRGGGAWVQAAGPLETARVNALLATPRGLYAGGDTALLLSTDGSSWRATALQGRQVNVLAAGGPSLFAGTGSARGGDGAVFRSQDGGQTWAPAQSLPAATGLPGEAVQALMAPGAGRVLAGTAGGGLYSSPDGVARWAPSQQGLSNHWVTAVIDVGHERLAGTDDGLFRSSDGGASWAPASFPIPDPWVQALVATGPGGAIAGTYDGLVLVMGTAGWRVVSRGLPSVYAVLPYGAGYLAGTDDGLFCLACENSPALPRGAPHPATGAARRGVALVPSPRAAGAPSTAEAKSASSPSGRAARSAGASSSVPAVIAGVLVVAALVGAGVWAARRSGKTG